MIDVMKKIKNKIWLLSLILCSVGNIANAQKLPNKQADSVWPTKTIIIDGKPNEWNYKAYNTATEIYYCIANDENNIYLSINVPDPLIIQKIISAGLTLTLSGSEKKSSDDIDVTFPIYDKASKPNINLKNASKENPNSKDFVIQRDSLIAVNNLKLTNYSKNVKVIGVKDLDTLISVYNNDGIKAAALFDNKMAYTYELCIALKYLNFLKNPTEKIFYNIKLNAITIDNLNGLTITRAPDGLKVFNFSSGALPSKDNMMAFSSATDFSGEYILAKKP